MPVNGRPQFGRIAGIAKLSAAKEREIGTSPGGSRVLQGEGVQGKGEVTYGWPSETALLQPHLYPLWGLPYFDRYLKIIV
jgi:hypothetical protein